MNEMIIFNQYIEHWIRYCTLLKVVWLHTWMITMLLLWMSYVNKIKEKQYKPNQTKPSQTKRHRYTTIVETSWYMKRKRQQIQSKMHLGNYGFSLKNFHRNRFFEIRVHDDGYGTFFILYTHTHCVYELIRVRNRWL